MKIGIYHNTPKKVNGCRKVAVNLFKGLDQLNIDYVLNQPGDVNGCLHGAVPALIDKKLPRLNTLVGPEIVVLPSETQLMYLYKNWCQPSQWVIEYMKQFPETEDVNFWEWPVGIDTEEFKPDAVKKDIDCFIYYKDVTKQTPRSKLNEVIEEVKKLGLKHHIFEYGSYNEDEYKDVINRSKFGIFLTGTESQGIALMEVMAMGCPIYLIDQPQMKYKNFVFNNASAAPYFGDLCGMISNGITELKYFIEYYENYDPRRYIMQNHTLKDGATKYLKILEQICQ